MTYICCYKKHKEINLIYSKGGENLPTPLEKTEALLDKAIADLESIRAKKADILEKKNRLLLV